ncbi:hypothetical protein [Frateuria sp. Soil773]|uniref:hypothetical protein n=1 Tax=Frateuria sp. Soil773 TaxID=1736407 RepID=UPI0012FCECE4|nr:hypothetical protein [Frateuria sp. Soil773]
MTSKVRLQAISGKEDFADLCARLFNPEWVFKLDRCALVAMLQRYLAGQVSTESVVDLANALEMNERVNVDGPGDVVINNVLFELANPEINGALTEAGAMALIETLQTD